MPIDMTTVKQIMHGAKEVQKIEDLNGNILWQKVSAKVLQSITLAGYTSTFTRGNTFSYGGTVTANYSDGTTADVTSSTTFSGYNMSVSGTYTVTASYTEDSTTVTATYSITVNKKWTQIWSGSKQSYARVYYSSWTNYTAGGVITTINTGSYGTASGVQARITFSVDASGKGGTSFTPSNKTSPVKFTGIGSNHAMFIKARGTASNAAYYAQAYCSYTVSGTTGTFQLYVSRNGTSTASNQEYYGEVTVTKIELYY